MKKVYIWQQKKDNSKINSVKQQIPTLIAINEIYGQVAVIKRGGNWQEEEGGHGQETDEPVSG